MKEWHLLARLEQERLTEWLLWLSPSDFCTEHPFVIDWMAIEAGHIAICASLGLVALALRPTSKAATRELSWPSTVCLSLDFIFWGIGRCFRSHISFPVESGKSERRRLYSVVAFSQCAHDDKIDCCNAADKGGD